MDTMEIKENQKRDKHQTELRSPKPLQEIKSTLVIHQRSTNVRVRSSVYDIKQKLWMSTMKKNIMIDYNECFIMGP